MTPELVGTLIERFGLPLGVLSIFAYLVLSGKLRPGSSAEMEIMYRERVRLEEREARLAAEKRLEETVAANRELTDALRDLERTVLRDQRADPPGPARRSK